MSGFYRHGHIIEAFRLHLLPMRSTTMLERLGLVSRGTQEIALAGLALAAGFGVMPLFIYFAGSAALGADGAGIGRIYESVYRGLGSGSLASWIVVLGPYGLCVLLKALTLWWRALR